MRELSKFEKCVKLEKIVTAEDLETLAGECWIDLEAITEIEDGLICHILDDNGLNSDQKMDLIDEILKQDEIEQKLELFLCDFFGYDFSDAFDKVVTYTDFEMYEDCTDLTQLGYRYLQKMCLNGDDSKIKHFFWKADTLEEFNNEIFGFGQELDMEFPIVGIGNNVYLFY